MPRCPIRSTPICILFAFALPALAVAQPAAATDPIRYTLRFPAPQTHYVNVEAVVPTARQPQVDLMMAVWTPGSYLVREYAHNVERVAARARDGRPLAIEKTLKNRWRIRTGGASEVVVTYSVYSRVMDIHYNWVDDSFAMLNGAATFMTLADQRRRVHDVQVVLPPAWHRVMTAMPDAPDSDGTHLLAPDFDTLVDSPMILGNPAVHEFAVDGRKHYLVNVGEGGVWDGAAMTRDLEKIVGQARTLWGSLPYEKYLFLNVISDSGGGGIEHKGSTMLMSSRWSTRTRRGYLGFLRLASHEYFHTWNVKRLRPLELGPFDYEHEVYPKGLWVSEGFTDYYGELQLRRARLQTQDEFLDALSGFAQQLQNTPGRLTQSVEMASFDAWIKQYRPDENSVNTSISYYTKGAVIALVLDARIRTATGGRKTLDDLMRLLYQRYSGERGFTEDDFRAAAQETAGVDLRAWLTRTLETTEELDYTEALDWFGLRFRQPAEASRRAWLGVSTRNDSGREIVTQIRRGTPAYDTGLSVDDEILAIDEFRVRAGQLATRLEQYKPGDAITVLVARRDELRRIPVTLGAQPVTASGEPLNAWRLEVRPDATEDQKAHLAAWSS